MQLYSYYQKSNAKRGGSHADWENHSLNDALIYSYRKSFYDTGTFPSDLHYHDYYELIVIEEGSIGYICESRVYYPQKGDIILIPPGKFHMSVIHDSTTQYNRHVFYFFPDAFDFFGCKGLCNFALYQQTVALISPSKAEKGKNGQLLQQLHIALEKKSNVEHALGISYLLQFFCSLNQKTDLGDTGYQDLPANILRLKNYIDENYATLQTSAQVAQQFFYSREHASRLFKKHFDITISEYILRRRILESQKMILAGECITDAAYAVGFNSLSAFIRGFRAVSGVSPSEYRKQIRK